MPLFSYKAKDKKGKVFEDVMQAANKQEVAAQLKSGRYQVLTIKNIDSGLGAITFGKISVSEKATFCRFMGTMLRAGLPLSEAIEIILQDTHYMLRQARGSLHQVCAIGEKRQGEGL